MKISSIELTDFKRFTNLSIKDIPPTTKLVVIVGTNGSGKSSIFDAMLTWYRYKLLNSGSQDELYYSKTIDNNSFVPNRVRINFHDFTVGDQNSMIGRFYFRTAYRNEADFTIRHLSSLQDPNKSLKFNRLIDNDFVTGENYQRLVALTIQGVYNKSNGQKKVEDLREELIGKIGISLKNVFNDLVLSSIGDPLKNGSFYFTKGISTDFHYKNLSAGEKSAFDLLLDLIIKSSYFEEAIFCIDEPELHMDTRLQGNLLSELYMNIPNNSQLWINTHSLGMLKRSREIEIQNPGTVVFLNFDNIDFDNKVIVEPTKIDKAIWNKFIEIALDDFSNLVAPKKVIFCEGNPQGRKIQGFDAQVYNKIFEKKYTDISFTSVGSCEELEKGDNIIVKILTGILPNTSTAKLVDRDGKSDQEVTECQANGIQVLSKRHIESYLYDDEIIVKLCENLGQSEKISEALALKGKAITNSVNRGNASDDIKSASGDIYIGLKKLLGLNKHGNTKEAFARDTLAQLITEDTTVFKELESEIFNLGSK